MSHFKYMYMDIWKENKMDICLYLYTVVPLNWKQNKGSWRGLVLPIFQIQVPFFGLFVCDSHSKWPKSYFPSENLPKSQSHFTPFGPLKTFYLQI